MTKELTSDLYSLSINGQPVSDLLPYLFTQSGSTAVSVTSTEAPAITTTFNVEVKAATLSALEIRNEPKQTLYYIGDSLKLEGLVVYAHYSDGTQIRLLNNEYKVSPLDTTTLAIKKSQLRIKA